jgi:hypothetical protein
VSLVVTTLGVALTFAWSLRTARAEGLVLSLPPRAPVAIDG